MSNAELQSLQDEIEVEEDFLRPRAPSNEDEMDITPMIDITFLLLIFFLVSSKMNEDGAIDLPRARHGGLVAASESVVVIVRRGTGDKAQVEREDGQMFSTDVDVQATEIAEYIQQGFDSGKLHVIVKAEANVRQGEISRVNEAISQALEEGQLINIAILEQS